VKYKF